MKIWIIGRKTLSFIFPSVLAFPPSLSVLSRDALILGQIPDIFDKTGNQAGYPARFRAYIFQHILLKSKGYFFLLHADFNFVSYSLIIIHEIKSYHPAKPVLVNP